MYRRYRKSKSSTVIGVRLHNEINDIVRAKAQEIGVSPSDLLRGVILKEFGINNEIVDKRQQELALQV